MKTLEGRIRDILFILAESDVPVTTNYIGEKLSLSSRTIIRKMDEIEEYLSKHNFQLIKKPGYGIEIGGGVKEKNRLKELIEEEKVSRKYSPEERQMFILMELLKSKEAIKIYRFCSELNVTEGTISLDLDVIEKILREQNINLIRKPGLGVYIEGNESQLRRLILNLLYENNLQNQIIDILIYDLYSEDNTLQNTEEYKLNNMVLDIIDGDTLRKIENIVSEFIFREDIEFNDNQFLSLIIHLALVVERIKSGDEIKIDKYNLINLKENKEFDVANKLGKEIEYHFKINIPEDEIGYITMHLLGTKKYFHDDDGNWDGFFIDNYRIIKTAKSMIKLIEEEIGMDLMEDERLLIDLSIHLEPTIKRIILGMEIRNPLLAEIKENYDYIFKLSAKAAKIIEEEFHIDVPEAEIGYIALHIGGAMERIKNHKYRVLVVCPSGIGVSRLLSTKLNKRFQNIDIIGHVSAMDVKNYDSNMWDFIVSTAPLNIDSDRWILVNPLFLEKDVENIKKIMERSLLKDEEINSETYYSKAFRDDVIQNMNYSRAILQVLDNYKYNEIKISNYEELIDIIPKIYLDDEKKYPILVEDILDREKLGQIILDESNAMLIHCRTDTIEELQFGIIKLYNPLSIQKTKVEIVIVLLAPISIDAEYIEIMGYITESIFRDKIIKDMSEEEIFQMINMVLGDFYNNKKFKRRM